MTDPREKRKDHEPKPYDIGPQRTNPRGLQGERSLFRGNHPESQKKLAGSGFGKMQDDRLEQDKGHEIEIAPWTPYCLKKVVAPDKSHQGEEQEHIQQDIKPPGEEPQEGEWLLGKGWRMSSLPLFP